MRGTRLDQEINRMDQAVSVKVADFRYSMGRTRPKGTLVERLVQLLAKASKNPVDAANRLRLEEVVTTSIDRDLPIPLVFLWAMGGQARSDFKFRDALISLPRLGDFWMFFWLSMLNQKVQTIYAPGLEVVIADEVPQLELLGFEPGEIRSRRAPLEAVAREFSPFVRIVELPSFGTVVDSIPATVPSADLVFAVVTSIQWECPLPQEIYDLHYQTRDKPWDRIRSVLPAGVWERAAMIQQKMLKIGEARKKVGFFEQFFGDRPFIDGAITDKGRWSPDAWSQTFPQHGGTVLASDKTQFSVRIVPEARLMETNHEPIMIPTTDFEGQTDERAFPFYWVKKSE